MTNKSDIFTIHKLWNQGFTKRQIAGKLQLDRGTVIKYLVSPTPALAQTEVKIKLVCNQDGQPVDGFTHICNTGGDINSCGVR